MSELVSYGDLSEQPSRQITRAALLAKESSELDGYRYRLKAGLLSFMDQCDTEAAYDAANVAGKAELSLLKTLLAEAAGSAAGVELVARWVEQFSNSNHQRYGRRFGG